MVSKIPEGFFDFGGGGVGDRHATDVGGQGGHVAPVELGQSLIEPRRGAVTDMGCDQGAEVVEMLSGVIEVDDLDSGGEVLSGRSPGLRGYLQNGLGVGDRRVELVQWPLTL